MRADLSRLNKAKTDKNRDVKWAWQADEARQVVDKALARAKAEPAGPKHEALMKLAEQARWMLEEFYVSLWAQELGTKGPGSLTRIKKARAGPDGKQVARPRASARASRHHSVGKCADASAIGTGNAIVGTVRSML